jgi:hypothetical protein
MSITRFFVDALGGALDLGLATPDDVMIHVTPDVLAAHLPRPLWAKLLTACLNAPRTDARLVVDTIGVVDLCANVPGPLLWKILADVAARALGKGLLAAPPPVAPEASRPVATATPVAATPVAATPAAPATSKPLFTRPATAPGTPIPKPAERSGPVVHVPATAPASGIGGGRAATVTTTQAAAAPAPAADVPPALAVDIDFDDDDDDGAEPAPLDAPPQRGPGGSSRNGARGSAGVAGSRRPQASAQPARTKPRTSPPSSRRAAAGPSDFDLDTDVGNSKAEDVQVDDEQLVDWTASEETVTSGVDLDRKR